MGRALAFTAGLGVPYLGCHHRPDLSCCDADDRPYASAAAGAVIYGAVRCRLSAADACGSAGSTSSSSAAGSAAGSCGRREWSRWAAPAPAPWLGEASAEDAALTAPSLQIFARTLSGKTIVLKVREAETIGAVKRMLQSQTGVPAYCFVLVHDGRALAEGVPLSRCGVIRDATVSMRLRPGSSPVAPAGRFAAAPGCASLRRKYGGRASKRRRLLQAFSDEILTDQHLQ
eukprot:TRINITY_DN12961_c0_g1_i1.p1 TRINITY_DN12961_c0_g1~~TRINITY_DN12961_c0_g1_i1.p1  ORF type:complete len:230 (-),score=50.21 TRINITY_DN12961_c0_g1_i1:129-818(-)